MEARVVQVLTSEYSATPHSTTNVSPREALNNRKLKTTLPEPPLIRFKQQNFMSQHASANIAERDAMQKIYADQKANAQDRNITPGDIVLMRQPKEDKFSTSYHPKPFVVEEKNGSMVTVRNNHKLPQKNHHS